MNYLQRFWFFREEWNLCYMIKVLWIGNSKLVKEVSIDKKLRTFIAQSRAELSTLVPISPHVNNTLCFSKRNKGKGYATKSSQHRKAKFKDLIKKISHCSKNDLLNVICGIEGLYFHVYSPLRMCWKYFTWN